MLRTALRFKSGKVFRKLWNARYRLYLDFDRRMIFFKNLDSQCITAKYLISGICAGVTYKNFISSFLVKKSYSVDHEN